jgi:NADP-dependent 3-hydroxy acid dehydrogenase YdfG
VSTSDTLDLAGTAVLVTGASSGIGRATALLLAARGANVAYCASKSAIESYSDSCRREFGDSGIRVCTLVRGNTETELLAPNACVAQASLRTTVARRLPVDDAAIVWLLQRPARAAVTTLEIRPLSQV